MRRDRGFTLIEILVVITIIAGLMSLVFILLKPAETVKLTTITKSRLDAVAAGLHQLRSPQLLGRFPSARMELLRGTDRQEVGKTIGHPNDTNIGIETVYVLLNLESHGVAVDLEEGAYGNTDGDEMAANPTRSPSKALFEYVDAWGNPFAYFSAMDYKNTKDIGRYLLADDWGGEEVEAKPWKSEKRGTFMNSGSFQLFSAGPDGAYNTRDDITNW